eukprot:193731-Rhodomonas_salina.1
MKMLSTQKRREEVKRRGRQRTTGAEGRERGREGERERGREGHTHTQTNTGTRRRERERERGGADIAGVDKGHLHAEPRPLLLQH